MDNTSSFNYYKTAEWGFPAGAKLIDTVPDDMKHLIHAHWHSFPPVNPMWHYILGIVYFFLFITAVSGNFLVMYLFTKTKELKTPANNFVVNLAFSDFCMMWSQCPMFSYNTFNGGAWYWGPTMCGVYAGLGSLFGLCSICTMAAIAFDRYNVIVLGMNGPRMTSGKSMGIILICWLYAGFWSATPFFGWGKYIPEGILDSCSFDYLTRDEATVSYTITLFIFDYCFPLAVICFSYFHIVRAICEHEKSLREQAAKMNVASLRSNVDANATSAEIRIAKIAMMNVTLWLCMWTPYAAICLQGALGDQSKITPLLTILPALCAKCASVANPLVFAISHPRYRMALTKTIPWFCIHEEEPKAAKDNVSANSTTTEMA